jgi:hypothetical protein
MKEKLELKHLAPYLPYDLRLERISYKHERFKTLTGYDLCPDGEIDNIKLILRPLSDLTKEIEVNGEKFVPIERLTKIFGGRPISFDGNCFYTKIQESVVRKKEDLVPLHFSQLDAFNKLFEWHFDIFGLIEKGLAISYIDINTLNKQQ